jgi:WD40 repeat protein
MTVLRLGAAQLHYHPAFEGSGKQPLREPLGTWEGAGLSGLRAGTEEGEQLLRALRERVEKAYVEAYRPRILAVVRFAAGLDLDLLVLPELSVPLALLPAVAEAAGARMTVVAGTHTVTAEGARKSGLYEALGLSPRPAIGSAVAPVLRGGTVIAAQAKLAASRWEPDLVLGKTWAPVALGPVEMGVLICIDFLKRGDGDVAGLVAKGLDACAVVAVPSLTPFASLEHFDRGAEELLYGYDRPVVYANGASEGGTRVFTPEEDAAVVLAAGRVPALAKGVEGVVAVEVRVGEARQRYRPVGVSRPLAAAVMMDAGVWGELKEAAEGVLAAEEVGEALDRVEAGREIWERAGAAGGGLPESARERWRYLAGGAEGTTSIEHLRALVRDVWVEGGGGEWRGIEKGLVEGAARVLREVEKKVPGAQRVTNIRGWLEEQARGRRFEGVEADGEVVEGVTAGLVPEPQRVAPSPPAEDGSFERWVRDPGPFPERLRRHGFRGLSWAEAQADASFLRGDMRVGPIVFSAATVERAAGLLALWGYPPAWLGHAELFLRAPQIVFVLSDGRIVVRFATPTPRELLALAERKQDDTLPLGLITEKVRDPSKLPSGVVAVGHALRALAHHDQHLHVIASVSDSDESRRFIAPAARLRGGGADVVLNHLDKWVLGASPICLLLGEFGSGKSTVSKHFAARLAQAALDSDARPVIFVDLRAWSGPVTIHHLVRRTLGVDNIAPYRFAVEEGECVLVLDGFDEMSNRLTPAQLADALRSLLGWRTERSKILLTCRTHLFIDPADLDRVFAEATGAPLKTPGLGQIEGAIVLELQLFDKERIQAYLARVSPEPERAWEAMGNVHDLRNLAERPLLLDMIRENLPALTHAETISLGDLYESYVQRWAEWPGPDEWLTPDQKITFAEGLAFCIWNAGEDVKEGAIRVDRLSSVLLRDQPVEWIRRLDRDEVRLELRAGTFLVWQEGDEGGYYRFAHRSFLEYALARNAVRRLGEKDRRALDVPRFSPEVLAYCKGRPGWGAAREEAAAILVEPYRARMSENALLLVAGEQGFGSSAERPWRLEGAALSQVSLRAARLAAVGLTGADLTGADLENADLRGARLERARLDGANLTRADVREAAIQRATARGSCLDGTRFEEAELREVGFEGSSAFDEAPVLRGARLEGACVVGTAWRAPAPGVELCGLVGVSEAQWHRGEVLELADGALETTHVEPAWHEGRVNGVAFSPDGTRTSTACDDHRVRLWEARTGRLLLTLEGHTNGVSSVAWSADGERLATGSSDATARVWEAGTGRLLLTLEGHKNGVHSVAWSADGERLATGSDDATARVWEAGTGRLLLTLEGHTNGVSSVAWSVDGERLATGSDDATARVWEAGTGCLLLTFEGHTDWVKSVAWSADGERLATGSSDATARVWEAHTGRLLLTLEGHTSGVNSVAWSVDGERLATGSNDATARVWEAHTGRLLLTLEGHTSGVNSVAWSADGERLATGSYDATARVWEVQSGRELAAFLHMPTGGVARTGPYASVQSDTDLAALVVCSGSACTPLRLLADRCLRPDLVTASLAGQSIPSLHISMDTAERVVSESVDAFLRPSEVSALAPIKSGAPATVALPWSLAPALLAAPHFRLTLYILQSDDTIHPLEASATALHLPALPSGVHKLLLTLHLGTRHERSFSFPLIVLAHNPYIAGPPVRGSDLVGRTSDLARLHDKLRHGSIQLTGERRIGKTSLLHHLADHPGSHIPIWLDAQDLHEPAAFRTWLTAAVRHHLPEAPADPADLVPYLRRLAASGKTPLLLVDEISLLQGLSARDAAWLRSLSSPPIAAVLAGSPFDWSRFFASLPDAAGSPFNHLQDLTIGPLTDPEMRRLVTRPGAVPPDDEAMRNILDLSGGRPYLAQRLCQVALDRVQREERLSITRADVDAAAREALVTGLDHQHKKRWAELAAAPNIQQALADYARNSTPAPRKLYDALQEHGLFDGLAWTVDPAFMMWIREREAG